MMTANVIQRVFHIQFGDSTGTAFAIEHGGRQYLITAEHVVRGSGDVCELGFLHDGQWKNAVFSLTGTSQLNDTAVLAPSSQIAPVLPMPVSSEQCHIGQDVYFLGFPYGIAPRAGEINRSFPFPFVKRACLSAWEGSVLFLDGHNNPGFSGGPVVCRKQEDATNRFHVIGIVSGYRFAEEPTFIGEQATAIKARSNTGIIIAHAIESALEIIESNPNGAPVSM